MRTDVAFPHERKTEGNDKGSNDASRDGPNILKNIMRADGFLSNVLIFLRCADYVLQKVLILLVNVHQK